MKHDSDELIKFEASDSIKNIFPIIKGDAIGLHTGKTVFEPLTDVIATSEQTNIDTLCTLSQLPIIDVYHVFLWMRTRLAIVYHFDRRKEDERRHVKEIPKIRQMLKALGAVSSAKIKITVGGESFDFKSSSTVADFYYALINHYPTDFLDSDSTPPDAITITNAEGFVFKKVDSYLKCIVKKKADRYYIIGRLAEVALDKNYINGYGEELGRVDIHQ